MREITADKSLIAKCGLYCGACGVYLKEKCGGCAANAKATWCQVRTCCAENKYSSCADCKTVSDSKDCKKMNNFISKIFRFFTHSDRMGSIRLIKEKGGDFYAKEMASKKCTACRNSGYFQKL